MTFISLQVCLRCHYHTDSTQKTLVLSKFKLKNYDKDSLKEQSIVLFYFFQKKFKGKFKKSHKHAQLQLPHHSAVTITKFNSDKKQEI